MKALELKALINHKTLSSTEEFPHVLVCDEHSANDVWMLVRKYIMNIPPDAVFRNHQKRQRNSSGEKRLNH